MQTEKKLNPITILGVWTVSMIVLTPVFMYTSNIGASGGEQKPFTILSTMIIVSLIGATAICLITPFVFTTWIKLNKWFFVLVVLFTIPTLIFVWRYYFDNRYSYVEKSREVNGNKIEIKTEYYDEAYKLVRSNSYWKNGKRDSTWTVFSKEGKLISEKVYRNGSLISRK